MGQMKLYAEGEWLALGRRRRLYLPARNRQVGEFCLRLFVWRRWQRVLGRLPLLFNWSAGFAPRLKRGDLESAIPHITSVLLEMQKLVGASNYEIAFSIGSPGPYQKISALMVSCEGVGTAFYKYAVASSADATIQTEADWLCRLGAITALRGSIPEIKSHGKLSCDRAYLLTDLSPSLETVPEFARQHEHFLSALGRSTSTLQAYPSSAEAVRIAGSLADLVDVFGQAVHADLSAGWADTLEMLASWHGPLVVAHRDFAPWNVRWSPTGVFVFDWEYAVEQANPLYDYFHFHLVQAALSKWRKVSPQTLDRLIRSALAYVNGCYPQIYWDRKVVGALLLAYLLDVMLFYTASGRVFDPVHPVLATYHALIRTHGRWLHP